MNLYVLDEQGVVVYANRGSEEVLGVPKRKLIGSHTADLVKQKVIDQSVSMRAFESDDVTVGELKTQVGYNLLIVSKVIRSKDGKRYVVTNSSVDTSMEYVMAMLEKERRKRKIYQSALQYFKESLVDPFVAASPPMQRLLARMRPAVATDSTVLLCGESGVGKDTLANYIHDHSPRSGEPIIAINCASIPNDLAESEFFGYEKGAFTGASLQGKIGFFEMANNSTLFLDEIGELPLIIQAKLLRVIEDRVVKRIGGQKEICVNLRIIAATNQNLQQMVQDKTFREDLYHRLNVLPFTIPPLRERKEDIIPLAKRFLEGFNKRYNMAKVFSDAAYEILLSYRWPGNVRELRNVVERLSIMTPDAVITPADLTQIGLHQTDDSALPAMPAHVEQSLPSDGDGKLSPLAMEYRAAERERVMRALLTNNGNKTKTAKALGVSKGKLYRLLEG